MLIKAISRHVETVKEGVEFITFCAEWIPIHDVIEVFKKVRKETPALRWGWQVAISFALGKRGGYNGAYFV